MEHTVRANKQTQHHVYFSAKPVPGVLRNITFHWSNQPEKSANNTSKFSNSVSVLRLKFLLVDPARFFTMCLLAATSTRFLQKFVVFCERKNENQKRYGGGIFCFDPFLCHSAFQQLLMA